MVIYLHSTAPGTVAPCVDPPVQVPVITLKPCLVALLRHFVGTRRRLSFERIDGIAQPVGGNAVKQRREAHLLMLLRQLPDAIQTP